MEVKLPKEIPTTRWTGQIKKDTEMREEEIQEKMERIEMAGDFSLIVYRFIYFGNDLEW